MTVSLEAPWFQPTCVALLCRPTHSHRRFAQLYIHPPTHAQSRASHARLGERHARARARACVGIARFVARVPTPTTAARPSRSLARFPSHARCLPRVSLHPATPQRSAGTAAAPRAHRLDEPSAGTIWAPTATTPPLSFLPSLSLPPAYPTLAAPPTATRRVAPAFFAPSSSRLLFAAIPSHITCRCRRRRRRRRRLFARVERRGRLKADVCANPNDLIACHTTRCVEARFLSQAWWRFNGNCTLHIASYDFLTMYRSIYQRYLLNINNAFHGCLCDKRKIFAVGFHEQKKMNYFILFISHWR